MLMHFINKGIKELVGYRYNDCYKKKKAYFDQPLQVNVFGIGRYAFNSSLMFSDLEINESDIRKVMGDVHK
jgi:hypothetical protein